MSFMHASTCLCCFIFLKHKYAAKVKLAGQKVATNPCTPHPPQKKEKKREKQFYCSRYNLFLQQESLLGDYVLDFLESGM